MNCNFLNVSGGKEINCLRNVISDSQSIFPFMVNFATLGTTGGRAQCLHCMARLTGEHFSSYIEALGMQTEDELLTI